MVRPDGRLVDRRVRPAQGAALRGTDSTSHRTSSARCRPSIGQRTYIEARARRPGRPGRGSRSRRGSPLASGRPRSALGDSDDGIIYLVPRGSLGRGPMLSQANVRLAATWRGVDVVLDVFNVFDHRDATNIDEVYAGGSIHPIVNGTPSDLVFLRSRDRDSRGPQRRLPGAYRVSGAALGRCSAFAPRVLGSNRANSRADHSIWIAQASCYDFSPHRHSGTRCDALDEELMADLSQFSEATAAVKHSPHAVSAWEEAEGTRSRSRQARRHRRAVQRDARRYSSSRRSRR